MFEKTGILGGDEGIDQVFRQLIQGDNDPFFLPESPDNFSVIAEDLSDDRRVILSQGSNIGEIARPYIPENRTRGCDQEDYDQSTPY